MASAYARRTLDLPTAGDFAQGAGPSTAQRANSYVALDNTGGLPGPVIAAKHHGAPWSQPVPVWLGIIGLLILLKYSAEKIGKESEFSGIRVGVYNTLVIGITAVIFITFAKWIFGYWKIPGVSQIVLAL